MARRVWFSRRHFRPPQALLHLPHYRHRVSSHLRPDPQPAQRTFKIGKPPNTRITKTKIDSSKGTASFSFKSIGSASSFQCELKQKRAKATFSHCKSPKTYKHLAAGNYTFLVRAVNSIGVDPTPAKKSFKL